MTEDRMADAYAAELYEWNNNGVVQETEDGFQVSMIAGGESRDYDERPAYELFASLSDMCSHPTTTREDVELAHAVVERIKDPLVLVGVVRCENLHMGPLTYAITMNEEMYFEPDPDGGLTVTKERSGLVEEVRDGVRTPVRAIGDSQGPGIRQTSHLYLN